MALPNKLVVADSGADQHGCSPKPNSGVTSSLGDVARHFSHSGSQHDKNTTEHQMQMRSTAAIRCLDCNSVLQREHFEQDGIDKANSLPQAREGPTIAPSRSADHSRGRSTLPPWQAAAPEGRQLARIGGGRAGS
jgi:hypothetical protein